MPATRTRRRTGQRFHSGLAAEEIAERAYLDLGGTVLARRWRCEAGEIDLVIALEDCIAFVEVKLCRSPSPDSPVRPRQWARIEAAAGLCLAGATSAPRACRFDAALVGSSGVLTVIENAHMPGLT